MNISDQIRGMKKYGRQISPKEIICMHTLYEKSQKQERCFLFLRNQGEDMFIEVCHWKENSRYFDHYVVGKGHIMPMPARIEFDYLCKNSVIVDGKTVNRIYHVFSECYPQLYLKKYPDPMHMIHHIYCTVNQLPEEIFYKSNLCEIGLCLYTEMTGYNMLGTSPKDILGLPVKLLQAFNSKHGVRVIRTEQRRNYILNFYHTKPALFFNKWSYAQCQYFSSRYLEEMDRKLDIDGKGHEEIEDDEEEMLSSKNQWSILFFLRKYDTMAGFCYYERYRDLRKQLKSVVKYPLIPQVSEKEFNEFESMWDLLDKMEYLCEVLFEKNEELESELYFQYQSCGRDLEYENEKFILRYPHSIEEIIQESDYMHNCLWTYADTIYPSCTNVLFLRKAKEPNIPYVDVEVRRGEVIQVLSKYNMNVTSDVVEFMCEYAKEKEVELKCCVNV